MSIVLQATKRKRRHVLELNQLEKEENYLLLFMDIIQNNRRL